MKEIWDILTIEVRLGQPVVARLDIADKTTDETPE